MTDITTIEEVEAGDYTVRVGHTDDGSAWEAVVLSEDSSTGGTANWHTNLVMASMGHSSSSDDSDDETPIGPPATAPHKWVAVGFAIEAYEWRETEQETVDVSESYKMFGADAELCYVDEDNNTIDVDSLGTQHFTGSLTFNPDKSVDYEEDDDDAR